MRVLEFNGVVFIFTLTSASQSVPFCCQEVLTSVWKWRQGEETEDGGGQGFPNCGKETDQLSPVSVLDFPYDDDEAAANFESKFFYS